MVRDQHGRGKTRKGGQEDMSSVGTGLTMRIVGGSSLSSGIRSEPASLWRLTGK